MKEPLFWSAILVLTASTIACGADSRPLEEQEIQTQGVARPAQPFSAEVDTAEPDEETDQASRAPASPPAVEQLQVLPAFGPNE